ncbi:MAG TPA: hypothetical protein VJV22_14755 [Acidobacteriaceae bacterium]|nr:hypothetical protein [Acidobacteriaceae bacterium]
MLHLAAGVCLGIVAAVYLLNWLGQIAEWRAERRERKAYRKMTPDEYQNQAVDRFAGLFILAIAGLSAAVFFFGH